MKIVVTGGSGKFGQYVIPLLSQHGHNVVNFDRSPPPQPADQNIIGDIEDLPRLVEVLKDADAVLHLAGIPTHGIAPDDVTFRINVMGAFNIHEAARQNNVRRVVSLSSEAVLGWSPGSWSTEHLPDYLPIDEDHVCAPQDCYGLSKQVLEAVGRSYTARCGMETIFLRATWIASPQEVDELSRVGGRAPSQFALFHYVDARDLAEACRLALECGLTGSHAFYIGAGETCVTEPLATLYPKVAPAIGDLASAFVGHQAPVSIELAQRMLGWSPKHSWRPSNYRD